MLYEVITIAKHPRVFLFTGPENNPARLARALLTAGYASDEIRLSVACRLQLADEQLFPDLPLDTAAAMSFPEPNVLLVRRDEVAGEQSFGLDDLDYIQRSPEKGLITRITSYNVCYTKLLRSWQVLTVHRAPGLMHPTCLRYQIWDGR